MDKATLHAHVFKRNTVIKTAMESPKSDRYASGPEPTPRDGEPPADEESSAGGIVQVRDATDGGARPGDGSRDAAAAPEWERIQQDAEPPADEEPPIDDEDVSEEPEIISEEEPPGDGSRSLLAAVTESEPSRRTSFEEFVDERLLLSGDALGTKQMKIKVLEVSDEHPPVQWRFGDRVKITKILVTIKHLSTQEVEEGEFNIEEIERELAEKRHYTSTNRWVPTSDIKNGYVVGARHTSLISDAVALDYIVF